MTSRFGISIVAACALGVVAAGCDGGGGEGGGGQAATILDDLPPAAIANTADLLVYATGSAPNAMLLGLLPYGLVSFGNDPNCPVVAQNGSTATYTGGCTDTSGNTFGGTMTITQASQTSGSAEYDGFSIATTTTCAGTAYTNTTTYNGSAGSTGTGFDVDVVVAVDGVDEEENCTTTDGTIALEYAGTITQNGDAQTFGGSGRIGYDVAFTSTAGTFNLEGVADVSTADEVVDDAVCNTEALSGTTTIEAGSDTAVITYDGATDCDPESTVNWSLNGTNMGEVAGIACAVHPGADARGLAAALAALAFGVLAVRRRR